MKTSLKIAAAFGVLCFVSQNALAQTVNELPTENHSGKSICGTEVPSQQWEAQFQEFVKQFADSKAANKTQAQVYTIPVIIHVIHGGQAVGTYPNLAQGQLNSQIQLLNNDFGGIGFNTANYPSTAFTAFATTQNLPQANLDVFGRVQIANCNVQFCLATKDSLGNILAEPGIERINYISRGWNNPGSYSANSSFQTYMNGTIKPQTIWNCSKYMNIWVSDIGSGASLLGYATFPPFSGLTGLPGSFGTITTDGFWCLARAFGSQSIFPGGTYQTGYTRGRTSTHEIGHYLGLRHTWGDGTCASDFCNDTPPAFDNNFGAPVYPLNATGTNSCNGATNGAMFMNFMDYTDDPAKYMYTPDQATRVQTAMTFSPYRKFLGTHNLCSVAAIAASAQFTIPATLCGSVALNPANGSVGTPVPTYSWSVSGGAVISPNNTVSVPNITFPAPGVYTITLAADNGTVSTLSRTITARALPNLVLSTSTFVCTNDIVVITASGANTYAWLPIFQVTPTVTYVATIPRSFTVTATDIYNCKKIDSVTVQVGSCVGINSLDHKEKTVFVYPNPSHDNVTVKLVSNEETEVKIEMTDASGRIVLQRREIFTRNKNEIQLSLESIAKGIYFLNVSSKEGERNVIKFVKD